MTYFCPALDPPLDGSGRKTTTLVRDLEYFIHTKFHQNPSSGSGEEVENVNSLTDDGRRTTDNGQRVITIGHWSLWLLCPKNATYATPDMSNLFGIICQFGAHWILNKKCNRVISVLHPYKMIERVSLFRPGELFSHILYDNDFQCDEASSPKPLDKLTWFHCHKRNVFLWQMKKLSEI